MNHKRRKAPPARAGCKMCKPQKKGGYLNPDTEVGHYGFGKIRALRHANSDLKEARYA